MKTTDTVLRVYIIGAIRAPHYWQVRQNIERARAEALKVWRYGHVAICPHLNSGEFEGALPVEVFLEGGAQLLSVCNAAVLVPGYEGSEGSRQEILMAESLGLTVWASVEDLVAWHGVGPLGRGNWRAGFMQQRCEAVS